MRNKLSICFFSFVVWSCLCTFGFSQDFIQSLNELAEYWHVHGYSGSASAIYASHPDLVSDYPSFEPTGNTSSFSSGPDAFTNILVFPSVQSLAVTAPANVPERSDWEVASTPVVFKLLEPFKSVVVSSEFDRNFIDDESNPVGAYIVPFPGASGSTRVSFRNFPTCKPAFRVYRDTFGSVGSWEGYVISPSLHSALTDTEPALTDVMLYIDAQTYSALRTNILRRTTVRFWARPTSSDGGEE